MTTAVPHLLHGILTRAFVLSYLACAMMMSHFELEESPFSVSDATRVSLGVESNISPVLFDLNISFRPDVTSVSKLPELASKYFSDIGVVYSLKRFNFSIGFYFAKANK
jgi:hypothetical protein